jgi:hypothetical protein
MRWMAVFLAAPTIGAILGGSTVAQAAPRPMFGGGPVIQARASEPVVITGSQIPTWTRNAATGVPAPYPSGVTSAMGGDGVRSAHNGIITVPPDTRTGVNPDQIAAYRWDGLAWSEVPVQVDQMYLYYLANGHSSFSIYSGTDQELTYAWNPTSHSVGEESWKKVFGGVVGPLGGVDSQCTARYQAPGAAGVAELAAAEVKQPGENFAAVSQPAAVGVAQDDYKQAMPDPVNTATGTSQLNDDDQVAMMAGDAGLPAPSGTSQPAGTTPNNGQQITIVDPTSAQDGSAATSYIYLFLKPGDATHPPGSSFTSQNGYVQMARDANADQWIDGDSFTPSDPEKIGVSNTGYGPNIPGNVCVTAHPNKDHITTPDGTPRFSNDRQPRDAMTVTTPTYTVSASGRWMVRQLHVTAPGTTSTFGPNLIGRWKGRAFQSSPDSSVSVVGFEDEQVNWEMNATLLGWKAGPVRAIREVWGADSGTNVTKTEIYYRDAYTFQYHVRVHPIPPDGLYTSWDFRYGAVSTYYNQKTTAGVPVDGTNTHSVGEVDQLPVTGQPAFFNACDPTFDICTAIANPEEIAGPNGSLVFVGNILPSHLVSNNPQAVPTPSTGVNPEVVPFYRDDACFDDGTGDAPVPRPYPGDQSTDPNVQNGYVSYWQQQGAPVTQYTDLRCAPPLSGQTGYQQANFATYNTMPFQGAIGEFGLHFFFTADSDNLFGPQSVSEIAAEQWVYAVPSSAPANLISADTSVTPAGKDYGLNVVAPLQTVVTPFNANSSPAALPEAPLVVLLPLAAVAVGIPVARSRRRRS